MPTKRLAGVLQLVAANVRAERIARGMTQEALAEAAGLEVRSVQDVEAARTNLSMGTFVALADALAIELDALLKPAKFERAGPGRPKTPRKSK